MIIKGAVLAKSTIDTTNLYALSTKSKWMHKFSLSSQYIINSSLD